MKWYFFDNIRYLSPIKKANSEYYLCVVYYRDEKRYGLEYYEIKWIVGRMTMPFTEDQHVLLHGIFKCKLERFEE